MTTGLIILGIILIIAGFLTPIDSGTTILVSSILFVIAFVLSLKKKRRL
ncbi:hypothetical protein [Bacillus sp. BHET2]|nr:hypothetical protein [Bacillus sp. BHET2]